jgi:hypothetical protein
MGTTPIYVTAPPPGIAAGRCRGCDEPLSHRQRVRLTADHAGTRPLCWTCADAADATPAGRAVLHLARALDAAAAAARAAATPTEQQQVRRAIATAVAAAGAPVPTGPTGPAARRVAQDITRAYQWLADVDREHRAAINGELAHAARHVLAELPASRYSRVGGNAAGSLAG